ncbi:UNVERIFIED_ORG: fructoselysine and glucoselysine-specific PTS system IIA component [Heyndrickxia coagulans]
MRKILIATHSNFAQGIKDALTFILGEQKHVEAMCAYVTQDFDIQYRIEKLLYDLSTEDELIVLVDLFGGSVSNAFSNKIDDERLHIISGVNFPMLLDLVTNNNKNTEEVIKQAIESGRKGIQNVNQVVKKATNEMEEDFL